ncbi:MAG: amidase [Acidimicrobiaceae bacterium]|nr:amidase [Acidimicrobiaceae bacterium]
MWVVAPTRSDDELGAFVPGARTVVAGTPGGELAGLRFVAKDLFDVAGARTGAGSPEFLADAPVAARHAPAVAALLAGGADLVGKTVTDELAFSLFGTNAHYGMPHNTAAPGRVPGGSSSGSASAVAGGAADLALGTDTAGSVRVPASYCGIFGLRPTHGRISAESVVPLAPSLDTVGLLADDGRVLGAAWRVLRGASGSAAPAGSEVRSPTATLTDRFPTRNITTLVCPPELLALLDDDARDGFESAADELGRDLGWRVVERAVIAPDELERMREIFRSVQLAEAWKSHGAWIERRRPQLGPGVASRFAAAAQADPTAAEQLPSRRLEVQLLLAEALGDDKLLLQPAACGPAPWPALGGSAKDDLRLRTLTLTSLAGLAGAPVVSLPLAQVDAMPLGVALVGLAGEDDVVVECAATVASGAAR